MKITSFKNILRFVASAALFLAFQAESQAQWSLSYSSPNYYSSPTRSYSAPEEEPLMRTFYIVETYHQLRDVDTGQPVKAWWECEYEGTDNNEADACRSEWQINLIDGAYFIDKATLSGYTGRLSEEVTYVRMRSEQRGVVEKLFHIVLTYRRIYDLDTDMTVDAWWETEYEGTDKNEAYATRSAWELYLMGGAYLVGKVFLPDYEGRLAEEVRFVRLRSEIREVEVEVDSGPTYTATKLPIPMVF